VKLAPAWRVVQVALGALLFLWAMGWLQPLRTHLVPYALLAGLLLAGAMWVTESVVASVAQALGRKDDANTDTNTKGPRE
jgi:hypothetical protein